MITGKCGRSQQLQWPATSPGIRLQAKLQHKKPKRIAIVESKWQSALVSSTHQSIMRYRCEFNGKAIKVKIYS